MKAPLRQETNFSHSITGTFWRQLFFEGHVLLREISHLTLATFETTTSSTVAEPFIDFWTPNVLVFTIVCIAYCIVQPLSVYPSKLCEFIGKVQVAL